MEVQLSTTAKGDNFEAKVFDVLQTMIANNELPINNKYSEIFRKKGYYSSKRKSNIVVDISVECTLPGEQQPSLYLMVECKDYKHPIPVNDIEEFFAKTQQITGLNVKAIIVTSNVLQEGALNFAIGNGIRVMRIKADGEREILSFKRENSTASDNNRDYINAILSLTSPTKSMLAAPFVGVGPAKIYHNMKAMIEDAIIS